MPESLDLSLLQTIVAPYLEVSADNVRLVPIGTGQFNTSLWVETGDERFVLRLAPPDETRLLFYEKRMMRQEPTLHALIRERTSIPIPAILASGFSREQINRDFVLLEAMPGKPISEAQLSAREFARTLQEVGECLSELHALTAPDCLGMRGFGYLGEHQPLDVQPTWSLAFRAMWNALLDDVVACGAYSSEEGDVLREALERHISHFDREVTASLLHMDVWAQNILVDKSGRVTGLIDFDRALWGDVEIEFAVLDYCGISEAPFWKGYNRERDDSHSAQVRGLFYLLYELQKYMPIEMWRGHNITAAMNTKKQCLELAEPLRYRL